MAEIKIKTAPADFRFPTQNQTRHCFTRYLEFHKCLAVKGEEGSADCEKFAKYRFLFVHLNGSNAGISRGKMEYFLALCNWFSVFTFPV